MSVLKKPLMTDKNNILMGQGIYVFKVAGDAGKPVIKEHIERYFDVKVRSVCTAVCRGRSRRTRQSTSRVRYWKKAYVRLKAGEKIDLFEGK